MRQGLLGAHPRIQEISKLIEQSARSNAAILLIGETGTGKEAAARLIHRMSNRTGPLVTVDCGAIPSQLLESELFGHEKGAFTGAEARKAGRVEEAHRGTLFLDEIGELPLSLQPKLLRVLQESTVRRVGGDRDMELDLRIVAATNRDLYALVAEGAFREDLLYRIRVIEIALPALRERGDDVLLLSLYFLRQYSAELGRDLLPLSAEAQAALLQHPWPGNIRELQNRLRRAAILASGTEITVKDLELEEGHPQRARGRSIAQRPPRQEAPSASPSTASRPAAGQELASAVEEWFWQKWAPDPEPRSAPQDVVESFLLRAALQVAGGSLSRAANLLGLHPATFRAHLRNLSDASLSRTIREHRLGPLLEAEMAGVVDGARTGSALWDELLRVLLKELLVYCQGNKTEMARLVGWGRATLGRYLARAGIGDAAAQ
jgi:DNA-binding NtrC family response regulator